MKIQSNVQKLPITFEQKQIYDVTAKKKYGGENR